MVNVADLGFKLMTGVHQRIFDLTKGRAGGRVAGMPAVKLVTTGRKSGRPRVTMLTSPVHDEGRVVLVASKGGATRHPLWYLNIRENPRVTITFEGRTRQMNARTASTAEKAELWPAIVAAYRGYASYQDRTERDIPVVVLEAV